MGQVGRLTRRERQEQTRERILDAALGVFRRTGFAQATIEEVAELAGITRGTVYLHFASKEGLLLSVLEHHLEDQVTAFGAQVRAARSERALVRLLVASVVTTRHGRTALVRDWAAMVVGVGDGGEDLVRRARAIQQRVDEQYGLLVERVCALRGVTPPQPPRRLAVLVLALCEGLAARAALDPELDLEVEVRRGLGLLLPGRAR